MNVPRDFDIFSPFTVRCPCTGIRSGCFRPAAHSIAGQNTAWKRRMSLPMKCSSLASAPPRGSRLELLGREPLALGRLLGEVACSAE